MTVHQRMPVHHNGLTVKRSIARVGVLIISTPTLVGCTAGMLPVVLASTSPVSSESKINTAPDTAPIPYTQTICGQVWMKYGEVPAINNPGLVDSPSPAPTPPSFSVLPTSLPQSGLGVWAFEFGDCVTGAMVTISPPDAVVVGDLFYAADGGIAFLSLEPQPGNQKWVLRAWSDSGGVYLGEYVNEGL